MRTYIHDPPTDGGTTFHPRMKNSVDPARSAPAPHGDTTTQPPAIVFAAA